MTIALVGFMGCGKSVVGNALARSLGWSFVDLDRYIVEREKQKINEIFLNKGEDYFRTVEIDSLNEVLAGIEKDTVLSLGGGTLLSKSNRDLLKRKTKTIYIQRSLEDLYDLFSNERSHRPLLKNHSGKTLRQYIRNTYKNRRPYYQESDLWIINKGTVEDIVTKIRTRLGL